MVTSDKPVRIATKLRPRPPFSKNQLVSFIASFALVGGVILLSSFAFNDQTGAVLYHSDGDLVESAGDPNIYLISGGQRHLVPLAGFESGRYKLADVVAATVGDEQYPVGSQAQLPAGLLVKDFFSDSYFVTDHDTSGQIVRRPIAQAVMQALGYNPTAAVTTVDLPPAQGRPMTGSSSHPDGTVLSLGRSGGTYVVDAGQLRPATADVLASYDIAGAPKLQANVADLALPKGPALDYADGTLVRGSDPAKVYVIDSSGSELVKRLIRGPEVFASLGYKAQNIHQIPDTQLPVTDGQPIPQDDSAPVTVSVNLKSGTDGTQLAQSYSSHSSTQILSAYHDWLALKLPLSDLDSLESNPGVAALIPSAQSQTQFDNCNDSGSGPPVPCPSLSYFSASPSSVTAGSGTTLQWDSANTDYCTAGGGWGGQVARGGTYNTGALTATTSFSVYCTGNGINTGTDTVTVSVNAPPPPPPPPPSGGSSVSNVTPPTVSGTAAVGSAVTVNNVGSWTGNPTSFTYQWEDCNADNATNRQCSNIGGATNQNYVITSSDIGDYLKAKVTASNGSSLATAESSNATDTVPAPPGSPPPPPPPSGGGLTNTQLPTISGTLQVGNTLTGSTGLWSGGTPTNYYYSWERCDPNADSPNRTCNFISGATAKSYLLVAADANYQIELRVEAVYNSAAFFANSNPTNVVQAAPGGSGGGSGGCDGSGGVYLYSGTSYSGTCSKFTASSSAPSSWAIGNDAASSIKFVGSWTADLYQNSNYGGSFSELTLNHPSLSGFDINNGTTSSIQISSGATADVSTTCTDTTKPGVYLFKSANYGPPCDYFTGISLRSEKWNVGDNGARSAKIVGPYTATLYSGMKMTGNLLAVPSTGLSSISGSFGTSSIYVTKTGANPPINITPPAISGGTTVGSLLTTTDGSWNTSGLSFNAPSQYVWESCSSANGAIAVCSSISGQTAKTYTTQSADSGNYIRSVVYVTTANGTASATSAAYGPIEPKHADPPTAQQLATQILKNPAIGKGGRCVSEDLQDAAAGKPGTAGAMVSLGVLELIAYYGQSHSESINAIESCGTGHCNNTPESGCPNEPHYRGIAVDFGSPVSTGRDGAAMAIIAFTESNFSTARFGQQGCSGGSPPLPAGFSQFPDSCTHLHVDGIGGFKNTISSTQSSVAPVVSAASAAIGFGQSAYLSWDISGLGTCFGSGGTSDWVASHTGQSTFTSQPLTKSTTFTLDCVDIFGNTISRDVTVKVAPPSLAQRSPGLAAIGWTPTSVNGVVAVVGTGVDQEPNLNVRYAYGPASTQATCSDTPGNYDVSADKHDTKVAEMIGLAGDGIDTPAGVAPGTTIVAVRATGIDSTVPTTAGIACGIRWAADQGIKIINVSSAAPASAFDSSVDLNNCQSPNAEAELSAICYANAKGAKVVVSAGNYADSALNYVPARYSQAITVTSANEFNGQPPNSLQSGLAPKDSASYVINGYSGFCGQGTDDSGQMTMDYSGGKANFYAAPVCVWLGETVGLNQGYGYGTSFAAAIASGVIARDGGSSGSLSKGGQVAKTGGHDFGYELHL